MDRAASPSSFEPLRQRVSESTGANAIAYAGGTLYLHGYASTDFGRTWTLRPAFNADLYGLVAQGARVLAVSRATSETTALYLDPDGPGAAPWQNVSDPAQIDGPLPRSFFSTGTAFLVGMERAGVLRSEGGAAWAPAGRFAAHHNADLAALTRHRGALVGAWVNIERIVRSADRGATWSTAHRRLPSLDDAAGFVSLDSVLLAAGLEGIYRSTDADAREWTLISTGLRNVDGFVRVGNRLYAGATGGLYQRPASGTTWTQVLDHNLNQFDAGVSGSRLIVNGGNGSQRSLRISVDGGQTWTASIPLRPALQVAATSRAFVAAFTNFGAFGGGTFQRSLDDGATWHNLKPALGDSLAPTLLDNRGDTLLAIGSTYLAASLDHGTTWRRVPHTGLGFSFGPGSETSAPVALTRMDDTLYVAFQGNGVWKRSLADLGFVTGAPAAARAATTGLSVAPNPARGATTVSFRLAAPGPATVAVVDALGRTVALLHDGPLGAGTHRFVWGGDAPPGLYVLRVATADGTQTQPLVRLR